MKRILFLLSLFVFFACEQENLDCLVDSSKTDVGHTTVGSRAVSTVQDFDPIAELKGIQVNVLNMEKVPYKYLSCAKKGNKVDLFDKDDGSMRQRWYIGRNYIKLAGGNSTFAGKNAYVVPSNLSEESSAVLAEMNLTTNPDGTTLPVSGFLVDGITGFMVQNSYNSMNGGLFISYLQPESTGSYNLRYKKGNNDLSTHWKLELVGDYYEFVNIQYGEFVGDYITYEDLPHVRTYTYNNSGKSSPEEAVFQLNETVEYKSEFTESQTVSISSKLSTGFSIGIPLVNEDASGNLSISSETSTVHNWAFTIGRSESKTISITDTYKYMVPAYKNIKMYACISSYKMSLTYVMTVRRQYDGRLFRVKGKWQGVHGTHLEFKVVDLDSGTELKQETRSL